jgi:hypothetical protein
MVKFNLLLKSETYYKVKQFFVHHVSNKTSKYAIWILLSIKVTSNLAMSMNAFKV